MANLTFKQWQVYRRSNPRKYYSPEIQNLVARDAETLGSKFFQVEEKQQEVQND